MKKRKVAIVIGTRPEAIKMAPVVLELRRQRDRFETMVVATAQDLRYVPGSLLVASMVLLGSPPAFMYAGVPAHALWWVFRILAKLPLSGPAARHLEREWLPAAQVPDPGLRALETVDTKIPSYALTHASEEVKTWFKEVGCVEVGPMAWGCTCFVGIKA